MDKWTVALFGHYKPRYELREKKKRVVRMSTGKRVPGTPPFEDVVVNRTVAYFVDEPTDFDQDKYFVYNVTGWERRAMPGDIVAFKPYDLQHTWTPTERKAFLIATIEGPTLEQMQGGVCEPEWDLNSYFEYAPMSFDERMDYLRTKAERAPDKAKALKRFNAMDKEKVYREYLDDFEQACLYPRDYKKKRRMHVSLEELEVHGVHLPSMLDREFHYSPNLMVIRYTFASDKMKQRNLVETDGLNLIPPRKVR